MIDLTSIKKRDLHEYGSYHDVAGSPVLHMSFGEKIINRIPYDTQLYMRSKRSETTQEANKKWYDLVTWLNKMLEPAYQAIKDRHELLQEVERLNDLIMEKNERNG